MSSAHRLIATPSGLRSTAMSAGRARGEAGGWLFVVTRPRSRPFDEVIDAAERVGAYLVKVGDARAIHDVSKQRDPLTGKRMMFCLRDWFVSAQRIDKRIPRQANLDFLHRFVVGLGAPDDIAALGSYYFVWPEAKEEVA